MFRNLITIQISNDLKSIFRDPFLRYITPIPLLFVIGFIGLKENLISILAEVNINYYQYSDLITSFFFLSLSPSMFGIVYGYLILDYKDEKIFDALSLTPVGNGRLLLIKLIIPYLLSVTFTGLSLVLLEPSLPIEGLFLISVLSGLNAPFYALLLGVLAKNKIQGMALQKVTGILLIIPGISYFFDDAWIILFGFDPLFWNFQAFWLIKTNYSLSIIYSLIGIIYYAIIIRYFTKRLT